MGVQGKIFAAFIAFVSVFMGIENWIVVLPIGLAVANGYVNKIMIDRFKVGKIYHGVQIGVLFAIMGALVWLGWVVWNEVLLMTMLYFISFEMSLNLFRGRDYDYIGENSWFDRTIRKMFKTYGLARTFLTTSKLLLFVAGVIIFTFNKPL